MSELHRAYGLLTVKSVTEAGGQTVITGTASTPETDRMGDIVEPMGAKFRLPMPLLWQHESKEAAVGRVEFAEATRSGIPFRAVLPHIAEAGELKKRVDLAIHSLKYGLVRAVSIGFHTVAGAVEALKSGGLRFKEWEWVELSLVNIPANREATIETVRSVVRSLAASGTEGSITTRSTPAAGVSAPSRNTQGREAKSMNVQDQIRTLEAKHLALTDASKAIFAKAGDEGRTTDDEEREQAKTNASEASAVLEDLKLLRDLERQTIPKAVAVQGNSTEQAMSVRSGVSITAGRPVVPVGTAFTRYAMALAASRGSTFDAINMAKRWKDSTPEVLRAFEMKADPGTVADATWAAPLAVPTNLASEFVGLLRGASVLGRLNLRRVPFNVQIPVQTAGSLVAWVGETSPKPVGELAFTSVTLGYSKVAGIVVISEELARLSTPSAEETVRTDLVAAISEFIDQQFLSESVAASASNPAGIALGVTPIPATGTDEVALRCDFAAALSAFSTASPPRTWRSSCPSRWPPTSPSW
jgi:HK97 family phage major capsid protein